jgi:curved DNA-binding protein CbpA
MRSSDTQDHYEVLQISPRADLDTIQRVFRHLAKRFHPDNAESGDAPRFKEIVDAYQVLADPEQRARYDVLYAERTQQKWRVFDQQTALDDIAADRRMRDALLSLLYTACRNDADRPGMGEVELERLLGCPEVHMRFHVWYLKENGWLRRAENGMLAITASGVDVVLAMGGPVQPGVRLLEEGGKQRTA